VVFCSGEFCSIDSKMRQMIRCPDMKAQDCIMCSPAIMV
jgi:hypothetical protein